MVAWLCCFAVGLPAFTMHLGFVRGLVRCAVCACQLLGEWSCVFLSVYQSILCVCCSLFRVIPYITIVIPSCLPIIYYIFRLIYFFLGFIFYLLGCLPLVIVSHSLAFCRSSLPCKLRSLSFGVSALRYC